LPPLIRKMTGICKTSLMGCLGTLLLFGVAPPLRAQSDTGYVGSEACAKCHASVNQEWAGSRHSKMVQPATSKAVIGDFGRGKLVLRGQIYLLQVRNGRYYITESYLTGKPWEHRVDYTLGSRRMQHYLTTLPDGRIILIPTTWDNVRKQWFHNLDINDPEEAPGVQVQLWNKTCYSCHVSREEKNFDLQKVSYHTTWQDFGINCERCHGPGGEHIAWANVPQIDAEMLAVVNTTIVNPRRLDSSRSTMVCAQCHSFRDIYVDGFAAGANYYDYFMPVMEYREPAGEDRAYWPDGRTRRFSNDAFGLWQSQCFLKGGATCVTCHARPHNTNVDLDPRLRPANNSLCTQCHQSIGADVAAHTHHKTTSTGSSCVECHMPATVISIKAQIRDHSMSIPVPENTIRHGIPNACNLCHGKDPEWALQQMNVWYGDKSRQKLIRRADAFTEARAGNPAAIPALLQIFSDASEGPLIRANAAGYLGRFPNDPSAFDALLHSFSDPEPLVRATAALELRPDAARREDVALELIPLLGDQVATVRMNSAVSLVAMGLRQLPGEDGDRFERAKELYRARAGLGDDDAEQQVAAGKFLLLSGDVDAAVAAFRASLKLDGKIPAQFYLARALVEKGDLQSARQILKAILPSNPQYSSAQKLLATMK